MVLDALFFLVVAAVAVVVAVWGNPVAASAAATIAFVLAGLAQRGRRGRPRCDERLVPGEAEDHAWPAGVTDG